MSYTSKLGELAKRMIRGAMRPLGLDLVRYERFPPDLSEADRAVVARIAGFTMTSMERQVSLVQACRYVVRRGLEGCFVECGVWRGGSSMAAALTFAQEGATDRELFLFDTFEGMTPPGAVDRTADGVPAQTHLDRDVDRQVVWCVAGLEDVRRNLASTGYPEDRIQLIRGPVEQTIPMHAPAGPIAVLRLDTDWYQSTRHELEHLFPRLVDGGVLIVDDYGHWSGARTAVDEYLATLPNRYYLHRIDYTGRLLVKH